MDLVAIQGALAEADLDGWLFCDFRNRDPLAYRILGLRDAGMATRRWYYFIPRTGEPRKLCSRVEAGKLESLPGSQEHYLAWTELHAKLRDMVSGSKRVAMQYSPMNHIPYVSMVDAGTIDLIRSFDVEVVSSADLVQRFEAVTDEAGYRSHLAAGDIVHRVKDEAFGRLSAALRSSGKVNEYELMRFIVDRFEQEGLTNDGKCPIVGFNDHPADPHFEPTPDNTYTLAAGDTILIDLWARRRQPVGIYYDVTWCGFAGDTPPKRYVEIFAAVCRARDAAVELVRDRMESGDGVRGYEVDRVCREVVVQAGYGEQFLHRTGHSIGQEVHGNGANIDDLETRDDRSIVPGTCFSVEPGIYLAGEMAVRTEIDVFVTPSGSVEVHGPVQQELLLLG